MQRACTAELYLATSAVKRSARAWGALFAVWVSFALWRLGPRTICGMLCLQVTQLSVLCMCSGRGRAARASAEAGADILYGMSSYRLRFVLLIRY